MRTLLVAALLFCAQCEARPIRLLIIEGPHPVKIENCDQQGFGPATAIFVTSAMISPTVVGWRGVCYWDHR